MKTITAQQQIEQLPEVVADSPDVMFHDDLFEVIQHLIPCTKGIAIVIVGYAMANKCTVMEAAQKLHKI